MRYLCFMTLLLLCSEGYASPSGCVINVKKHKKMDPSCKCLKEGNCYGGKKIKDKDFFSPINGKHWISYDEKNLLKQNHILHNQIINYRAKGVVRSREARKTFQELNTINQKLKKIQKTHNDRFNQKINAQRIHLKINGKKEDNKGYLVQLVSFAKTPFKLLAPSIFSDSITKKPIDDISKKTNHPMHSEFLPSLDIKKTLPDQESASLSQHDRTRILKGLKNEKKISPQKFMSRKDDPLFTRISKAYFRTAYEVLLSAEPDK